MPYSSAYNNVTNLLRKFEKDRNGMNPAYSCTDDVGNIILWTVVECGMGVIAGSLPMLRQLFKGLAKDQSSRDESYVLRARSGRWPSLSNGRTPDDHESPPDTETDSTHRIMKTSRGDASEGSTHTAEVAGTSWQTDKNTA